MSNARPTESLFLPRALRRSSLLVWLKRSHAWAGLYGALFFFLFGLTGFYFNHRAMMQVENGRTVEVAALDAMVEPGSITGDAELGRWVKKTYRIDGQPTKVRDSGGGSVTFEGQASRQPQTLEVLFRGPNAMITATHVVGSNVVHLERSNQSPLRVILDLHKVLGVGKIFVLLMDTVAGALIFVTLSGALLWSELHGPRVLAIGLVAGAAVLAVLAASGYWLTWSLP
jgi:uncharacterized protein